MVIIVRKIFQRVPSVVMTVCILLALPFAYLMPRHQASESVAAFGASKREQLLARSKPLLSTLMTGSTDMNVEISLNRSYRASNQTTPTWIVDCSDSAQGKNAQVVWNADTGELMYASQWNERVPTLPIAAPITRNQAIALSRDWLHALPLRQEDSTSWRVVVAKPAKDTQWKVQFQGGDRVAEFGVNAATGQLVWLAYSHLPASKIASSR